MILKWSCVSGAVIPAAMLFLCTGDKLAGTAGSETVNTFSVVVVDKDNKPVPDASVRLVAGNSWLSKIANNEDPLFMSVKSGKNGVTKIPADSLAETDVNLCAGNGTIGAFIPSYQFAEEGSGIHDTVVLKADAVLSGSVNSDGDLPSRVILQGTDYSADVDRATGEYRFASVPEGNYHVIAAKDSGQFAGAGIVALAEGAEVHAVWQADFSGVLVDNFDNEANLMSYFKIGNWYIVKNGDISVGFPADREVDTSYVPYSSALVTGGAREGKSLHVSYRAGTGLYFLIIGAKVSTSSSGFANIDTITFWAKGSGRLKVRLHGEENGDQPQVFHYIDLDTAWRQYTVISAQYQISDPSNTSATWDDVKGRMAWLSFLPGSNGTDFWLDDVRLEGVTMKELLIP